MKSTLRRGLGGGGLVGGVKGCGGEMGRGDGWGEGVLLFMMFEFADHFGGW